MVQENREGTTDDMRHASMHEMIYGCMVPPMLYVAAQLGIADLLADGPQHIDALTAARGTQASSLSRVLCALASRGVFTQDEGQRFALTPLAALLRTNIPGSLRAMMVYWGSPWLWHAWSHLLDGVQTGQIAFDLAHGTSFFAYLAQHPDDRRSSISIWRRHRGTGTPRSLQPPTSLACVSWSTLGVGTGRH
jgi:hypothetical protein